MNIPLRILFLVCSFSIMFFVLRRIRRSSLEIADSIFWLILAAALIVIAVFPELAYWASGLLGFNSPSNFIFACGIVVLLVRTFTQDQKICTLRRKLTKIAQNSALHRN